MNNIKDQENLNQKKVLSKVLSSWWIDAGTPERIEELKKLI